MTTIINFPSKAANDNTFSQVSGPTSMMANALKLKKSLGMAERLTPYVLLMRQSLRRMRYA